MHENVLLIFFFVGGGGMCLLPVYSLSKPKNLKKDHIPGKTAH
jgi:hypothetical protein